MSRTWVRALLAAIGMIAAVLVGLGSFSAKLTDVESNRNQDFLPASAEATRTLNAMAAFIPPDDVPTVVLYERKDGALTDRDKARVLDDLRRLRDLGGLDGEPTPPIYSPDGHAVQLYLPLDGADLDAFVDHVDRMRELVKRPGPPGLDVYVTGLGGVNADLFTLFQKIDGPLLLGTVGIVILILLVVYRSPVLWLFPVVTAGVAYVSATGLLYLLVKSGAVTLNTQSSAIVLVLIFGTTTDYSLLLIARYREELHLHESTWDAMRAAWRGAMPAVVASAATVALGLLCLLASELEGNKGLGPVCAVGVACAALAALTVLPALLLLGRWVFWPKAPHVDGEDPVHEGLWSRLADRLDRGAGKYALATVVVLVGLTALAPTLKASGVPYLKALSKSADSVQGQTRLEAHFPGGLGAPVQVIAPAAKAEQVRQVLSADKGISLVVPFTSGAVTSDRPEVKDGKVLLLAVLKKDGYSESAKDTIKALRRSVDAASPDVLVGGSTAIDLDIRNASLRDNKVILPIVVVLIFVVLCLLLRAVVAPLLLMVTVVLSYLSALGMCALLFNHVFHYPGADAAFPLFAFVFLVALGVDYNIFLMTRVREEAMERGTHEGMLRGLTVTGGVITSAGIVLAATFATLIFTGLVFAAEMGIAVAFGVLLDTLVVRSLLVPALVLKLGDRIWWPSRLGRQVSPAAAPEALSL